MCGRYVSPSQANVERAFHIGPRNQPPLFEARYNAAPTLLLPVCRAGRDGAREIALLRWGLIPPWARDASIGARMINARAETLSRQAAFRSAYASRRCLVPMAGFYEWRKTPSGKVAYYIHHLNTAVFAVAGLYESWRGAPGEGPIESYTVITTEANELVKPIHDRMPVLLAEQDWEAWLDPQNRDTGAVQDLLRPYPAEELRAYPVGPRVNSAKNDDPQLIEPAVPPVEDLFR